MFISDEMQNLNDALQFSESQVLAMRVYELS